MASNYLIKRIKTGALGEGHWGHSLWQEADELAIASFHPQSSDHRPRTLVRAVYDDAHLFIRFEVHDRFVLSTATEYQAMVCLDSCAEFFGQPKTDRGYFNFEMNCGGAMLLYYIEDSTRTATAFVKYGPVSKELAGTIRVHHSMPAVVTPERTEPTVWHLSCRIPFLLFEHHVGSLGNLGGMRWRGNFFKCADNSSHPHWASWSPIGPKLNFHQPDHFGEIRFE